MVNLHKFYFLSSHFSSQPNKRVFHPSTFLLSQPNTYKEKTKSFLSFHFSILSPFSILPPFHSPNQTNPKFFGAIPKNISFHIHPTPLAMAIVWNTHPMLKPTLNPHYPLGCLPHCSTALPMRVVVYLSPHLADQPRL